jgi:hypothetical protein
MRLNQKAGASVSAQVTVYLVNSPVDLRDSFLHRRASPGTCKDHYQPLLIQEDSDMISKIAKKQGDQQ